MDAYDQGAGADRTRAPEPEPAPEPDEPIDPIDPIDRADRADSADPIDPSDVTDGTGRADRADRPEGSREAAAAPGAEPSGWPRPSQPSPSSQPPQSPRPSQSCPSPSPSPSPSPQASQASQPSQPPLAGVAALSLRYQLVAALALAVVAVTVCTHLGMVFLHVAPSNTLSKQHGKAVDDWVYPEFEQNWKLFAPNPLQQNIAVQVRADIGTADGGVRTTGWYDLSAEDGRAIDGNPLPSHTDQNELRRAWDFFVSTHDTDNRPNGQRGALSQTYLTRIVLLRLAREGAAGDGGTVQRVQLRSRTTNVPPPRWSGEKVSDQPTYRVLPWWPVPDARPARDAKTAGAVQ
ncbi:DUF5819 family protein [Streptomyces griseoviridis]|uniref:DUF5819 family protein n=1 Tax=Streptomyces griseoviridis TaxID=45398 RepID=UPI0033CB0103